MKSLNEIRDELADAYEIKWICGDKPSFKDGFDAAVEHMQAEISKLKAQLWVAKDAQLRSYDGLAQQAARVPELEAQLANLVKALDTAKSLTFSWVIAAETAMCKHTYSEIRDVIDKVLAELSKARGETK